MEELQKRIFAVSFLGLLVLAIVVAFIWFAKNPVELVMAGAGENASGWAWSENIGWISFNSSTGGGGVNYGVHVDPDSLMFSGHAWSEHFGFITFNILELAGCLQLPCEAKLDLVSGQVSGWARACTVFVVGCGGALKPADQRGGWDGWIKLRDNAALNPYGVSYNFISKELSGWAWGGGSEDNDAGKAAVGWISFNCLDRGVCGLPSNYRVRLNINFKPTVINLNYNQGNYCLDATALRGIFSWAFSDPDPTDSQTAYQVQVATDAGFGNIVSDSNKVVSISNTYSPLSPLPSYNTAYFWRIKLWDSLDLASDWVASSSSFSTPLHAYPKPAFSFDPPLPAKNESVQGCSVLQDPKCLVDLSRCYDNAGNQISCSGQSFNWTFPPDVLFLGGSNNTTENPHFKFTIIGNRVVSLSITDNTLGVTCSTSSNFRVIPLPRYKEISP